MANSLVSITSGSFVNIALPCPSDYKVSSSTLVDSARNADGVVAGSVIRNSVRKVEMSWNYLSLDDFSMIAKLFDEDYGGSFFFQATFFDPTEKGWITKDMYVGDRITDTAHIKLDTNTGMPIGYTNVSLSLVEC